MLDKKRRLSLGHPDGRLSGTGGTEFITGNVCKRDALSPSRGIFYLGYGQTNSRNVTSGDICCKFLQYCMHLLLYKKVILTAVSCTIIIEN